MYCRSCLLLRLKKASHTSSTTSVAKKGINVGRHGSRSTILKASVEVNRRAKNGVDDVRVVIQLLVHHKGKDTHLGGAAVVQLDGALLVDEILGPAILGGHLLLAPGLDLVLAVEESHLQQTDGVEDHEGVALESGQASKTGGDLVKALNGPPSASSGHEVAKDGKHRNTAVLGLHVTESVESLLGGVVQETQRIPETKRRLSTDLSLETHLQGRRGLGDRLHASGGHEGGGTSQSGGEGGELQRHFEIYRCFSKQEVG